MEPGESINQDGEVIMTKEVMEALSPWLKHPRRTIIQVEAVVVTAAALLLLQLILGSCKRRWHNSFLKYGLQVCTKLMDPLIIYTLATMQSSPIKSSLYPVWLIFLVLASTGTATVQEYDFHSSLHSKYMHALVEASRLLFYVTLITVQLFPHGFNSLLPFPSKNSLLPGNPIILRVDQIVSASSYLAYCAVVVAMAMKIMQMFSLIFMREYKKNNKESQQIWDSCGDSEDGNELKELCRSYALFKQLLRRRYFGVTSPEASLVKDFVFKKLLPPQGVPKAAFRTVEAELGFCYDFFFTKYHYMGRLMTVIFASKMATILMLALLAIEKRRYLNTKTPMIRVPVSEADYIITLLVVGVALIVELAGAVFYLASDWVQVSRACNVKDKENDRAIIAFIRKLTACVEEPISAIIGWLRRVIASGVFLRKKIDQYSVLFGRKDPVDVSDTLKEAIARSLRSTYGNQTNEETSLRQIEMFDWISKDHCSQLEVMLIWHIATEYCDMSDDHRNGTHRDEQGVATKLSEFWASLVGQGNGITPNGDGVVKLHWSRLCAQVIESIRPSSKQHHQNVIATRDGHRGVAVHLSRYCAYLIGSVLEMLPYQEADIAELAEKMMEERKELFGSYYIFPDNYDAVKNSEGTEEDHNPTTVVRKGLKLGKQLEKMADDDERWKVMEDFWADAIIHAAALPYTTKQHMERLENGGEFLTHIWALLAHAGILDKDKDQQGRGVRIPVLRIPVTQEANLGPGPSQAEIV